MKSAAKKDSTVNRSGGAGVVLVSGGIDSTVLLHHMVKDLRCDPIRAVSFQYGQRHAKELECARRQTALLHIARHEILDLSFLGPLLRAGTALVTGGLPVPDLDAIDAETRRQPLTYVPNRNMMLLAIAAAYAEAQSIYNVYYGAQAQDEYGYWDCTAEFVERINRLFELNRMKPVRLHAPFVLMKKSEIVRMGHNLGVDFSQTWSCYRGVAKACGGCPTCVDRLKAFRLAGLQDPLPYASI